MERDISRLPHRTGRAPADGVEIFYRLFGAPGKTPLLIAHGLSFFSYDWVPVAAALARDREVVAMDMRGFGQSGRSPTRDYGLRSVAGDVVALMDHLNWDEAVLAGHSMGGRVCLLATGWHPQRVKGLACIDFAPDLAPEGRKHVANSIGRQPDLFESIDAALAYHGHPADLPADAPMRRRFENFLEKQEGGYRLRRDLYYRDKFRAVLEGGKREPEKVDAWSVLGAVDFPFLVIRGATSNLFAAETKAKVRAANPLAEVVEIAGSHDLAHDNPEGVVVEISNYLDRHRL